MARKSDLCLHILYWIDKRLLLMLTLMLCILCTFQGLLTIDSVRHRLNYEARLQDERFECNPSLYTTGSITIRTDATDSHGLLLINGNRYYPLNNQISIEVSEGDVLHLDGRMSDGGILAYITADPNIDNNLIKSRVYTRGKLVPVGKIKYK